MGARAALLHRNQELAKEGKRQCNTCGEVKCLSDFPVGRYKCHACKSAWVRDYNKRRTAADPEYRKADWRRAYLKRYGLTPNTYADLLAAQEGTCAICGALPTGEVLYVDHDHETGTVRGLLCHFCNTALGLMADNPMLLRSAADYLERNDQCRKSA